MFRFQTTGGDGGTFAVGSAVLAVAARVSLTIDQRVSRLRPAQLAEEPTSTARRHLWATRP
jgi:hypothetical protein